MTQNKPSIFLADDDALLRELLKAILREGGYEVVGEAGNAETTMALCRKLCPGLVLLDINMPGGSGMGVLKKLKVDCPDTRVIMISGEATLERVNKAGTLGAAGFIVKPFNAKRVLDELAAAVARSRPA